MKLTISRLAYRGGVTTAVTAPMGRGFLLGMGTAFSAGADHKLEKGAIVQPETAVHVHIARGGAVSVSSQIAVLRRLLFHFGEEGDEGDGAWARVRSVSSFN
jgi:hypothetical protein